MINLTVKRSGNTSESRNIVLCSVPGSPVLNPSNSEREYWNNYLTLLESEGVYTVSKGNLEFIGNSNNQNIGLLHLAGILKQRGHNVRYVAPTKDTGNEELESKVISCAKDADFVGYSFHTCGEPLAEKIAREVKSRFPRVMQLAGGPHISGFNLKPAGKNIDVYFKGRSHLTLPWFIENPSNSNLIDLRSCPDNYFGGNTPSEFPSPDNSFMSVDKLPAARIYTSLGCGKRKPCTFCGSIVDHLKYMTGSLDSVFNNLQNLVERYNPEFIYIGDEDFFRDPTHSKAVVQKLESEYKGKLRYSVQASVETLKKNQDLLETIARTGMCNEIQVGVESADQTILKMSRKALRINDVKEIGRRVNDQGIKFFGYWLSWLPGETLDTHKKTTDYICDILSKGGGMDYAEAIIVVPFPGTTLFDEKEKYGIKIIDHNYSHWRGENIPVFEYSEGPSRELMYELYIDRIQKMSDILKQRMPTEVRSRVGVDPFKVMTGF